MSTVDEAVRQIQAVDKAKAEVLPFAGACDGISPEAVYLAALRRLGHSVRGLHPAAARAAFRAVKDGGRTQQIALDAGVQAQYQNRFPGAFTGLKRAGL